MTHIEPFSLMPIAIARTPYIERYGAPHQASTLRGTRSHERAEGRIELLAHIPSGVLNGLEEFELVWAIYILNRNRGFRAVVRPPRAPHREVGVLATRAPHRPTPIGLSALRIVRVEARAVIVVGIDLLDATPVLDLKPYVPYADAFPGARAGWVDEVVPDAELERRATGAWEGHEPDSLEGEAPDSLEERTR